ncbi:MAG TPA: 50S ribosomal protein L30 [Nitrososphaeraceae archaeon]|nr:50S ribosomal protein L30 [Nitrososphaeraceae archaeon]
MVYLVVRIRGIVNVPSWAHKTLENLNLRKKFNATLVSENNQTLGMLRKVKDIVAWKSVDESIIKELLEKRGRKKGLHSVKDSIYPSNNKTIADLATVIHKNNISLSELVDLKPWFSLSPPKGGFKRKTKTQYTQKGTLGENNELINLVRRMI